MSFSLLKLYRDLPLRYQRVLLTILLLILPTTVAVVSVVMEEKYTRDVNRDSEYSSIVLHTGDLARAVLLEAQQTIAFISTPDDMSAYEIMIDARRHVDDVYKITFDAMAAVKISDTWVYTTGAAFDSNVLTRQGLSTLLYIRSRIQPGTIGYDPLFTRTRYLDVVEFLVALIAAATRDYGDELKYPVFIRSNAVASLTFTYYHLLTYKALYDQDMAKGDTESAELDMKVFLLNVMLYQNIVRCIVRPMSNEQENLAMNLKSLSFSIDDQLSRYLLEATKGKVVPSDVKGLQINTFNPIIVMLNNLQEGILAEVVSHNTRAFNYMLYPVIVLLGLGLLAAIAEFVYFRLHEARASRIQVNNDRLMHDVLVRVAEYVREIAGFTLNPPPHPRTLGDKRVSIVELQLTYLVGALKAIAPSLPPLLFPQNLRRRAAELSEVKDPATMVLTRPQRDNLRDESLHLIDANMINSFLVDMERKTDLQEELSEVALLYVSLIAFHNIGTDEKRQFAEDYFQKIVTTVEECVYQFHGVVHTVALDKLVAVWNLAERSGKFCEQAASCALVLAERLATLREQRRLIRDYFPVHIGVVGGTVDAGIFGDEEKKYVNVFGPPTLRAAFVAQTNMFHSTNVTCDDYVRNAVDRAFLCKPIELIPDGGGRVYTLIRKSDSHGPELLLQLGAYTQAFELFEKRCYKSASKAFKMYTKQYGYDSSVERLLLLITGGRDYSA